MNAITRFERMDDLLPEMFRRFARPLQFDVDLPADIRLDVTENDKEFLVTAEMPGVRKDDLRVVVDGRSVSISAEVRKDVEERQGKNGRVLLKETSRGSVSRSFTLTQEVDDKTSTARLEDGMLRLTLPKRANSGSRVIAIE